MERNSLAIIVGVTAAVILCAAAVIPCALVVYTQSEYSISYELDSGVNDANNPVKYKYGQGAELYAAHKDGYLFIGWYSDQEYKTKVDRLTTADYGDKTLYAKWAVSTVGQKWTYTVDGQRTSTIESGYKNVEKISGSYEITQLMYAYDCGYYVDYDYSITTGIKVDSDAGTYYTCESELTWSDTGTYTEIDTSFGKKYCSVMECSDGSETVYTQYVCVDDGCVYKLTQSTTEKYWAYSRTVVTEKTYILSSKETLDSSQKYDLDTYCDVGVSVTGSGQHTASSSIKLTMTVSEGTNFKGWYTSDNVLLSRSTEFAIAQIYTDYKIYAMNDKQPDVVFDDESNKVTYTTDVALTDVTWSFTDVKEKTLKTSDNVFEYTFSESGMYYVDYVGTDSSGQKYCGTLSLIAGGAVKQVYNWSYGGNEYTETLYIKYSDYQYYCNLNTDSRTQGSEAHDRQFVTYQDQYVVQLGTDLRNMATNLSDAEFAQFVLNFVQYIEYKYDSESKGVSEYWKYPVETLFEQCGDCEDTSILYCAIMKSRGYDTALLLYTGVQYSDSGHCACGIAVDGATGSYYEKDGKRYYYCETTAKGWTIGKIPDGYDSAKVIPI